MSEDQEFRIKYVSHDTSHNSSTLTISGIVQEQLLNSQDCKNGELIVEYLDITSGDVKNMIVRCIMPVYNTNNFVWGEYIKNLNKKDYNVFYNTIVDGIKNNTKDLTITMDVFGGISGYIKHNESHILSWMESHLSDAV